MDTNEAVEHSSGRHKSSFEQNVGMPHHISAIEKQLSGFINMITLSKEYKLCYKTGVMGPFDSGDGKNHFYLSI